MNKVMWGGIIVCIATVLSMSMIPANASQVENICVVNLDGFGGVCTKVPEDGQHALLIAEPFAKQTFPTAGCHYTVSEGGDRWNFELDHGPEKCPLNAHLIKVDTTVRGS